MKRERPTAAAPRRIIEKEKVLTNMQEHLKHIQELEAERAAKHQEKRDKAKQKARPRRPWIASVGRGLSSKFEPVRTASSDRPESRPNSLKIEK